MESGLSTTGNLPDPGDLEQLNPQIQPSFLPQTQNPGQHEVGAIAVSRMLRDAGMEVIYTGRFNLPELIVQTSIEEDVDVIGLSCHSWEYLYFVPQLLKLLAERKVGIPVVVGGSIITSG